MEHGQHQARAASDESLAPIQSHRLSVEAEATLMNQGRGRQLVGVAVGAVALLAIGIVTLQHLGKSQAYADAATAAGSIEQSYFEGYFLCVLPGATGSQLTSGQRIQTLFERAGDRLGKRYSQTLNGCAARLTDLRAQVTQLPVPDTLSAEHGALAASVERLEKAHEGLAAYLGDRSTPYDFAKAVGLYEKLGLAFQDYRKASAQLKQRASDAM